MNGGNILQEQKLLSFQANEFVLKVFSLHETTVLTLHLQVLLGLEIFHGRMIHDTHHRNPIILPGHGEGQSARHGEHLIESVLYCGLACGRQLQTFSFSDQKSPHTQEENGSETCLSEGLEAINCSSTNILQRLPFLRGSIFCAHVQKVG